MKTSLCAILLACASTASAQLSREVTQPVPEWTGAQTDVEGYLYNVDAGVFYTRGNAWGSQASVGSEGMMVHIADEGDAYTIENYYETPGGWNNQARWYNLFIDSETALYTDWRNQDNFYFDITDGKNGAFRISSSPNYNWLYQDGCYMGFDKAAGNTVLLPFLAPSSTNCVDWGFVDLDAYARYLNKREACQNVTNLFKLLDRADMVAANEDYDAACRAELTDLVARIKNNYRNDDLADNSLYNDLSSELRDKTNLAVKHPTRDGADVTAFLVNPDFEDGTNGWTLNHNYDGNVRVGGTASNHSFEAWNNSGFDIYQEVGNTPLGVYEIQVQGFYRYQRGDNAWNAYSNAKNNGTPMDVPVYIYMNNNATRFQNIFDEPVPYGELYTDDPAMLTEPENGPFKPSNSPTWFPNDMYNSSVAFSAGMYKQSAYGLVAREGDVLRLGVKGSTNQAGDSWVIWDDFKLIYRGYKPDVVRPVLELALEETREYNDSLMGKSAWALLDKGNTLGAQGMQENDGEKMFNGLVNLYDGKDTARVSSRIFYEAGVRDHVAYLHEAIIAKEGVAMSPDVRQAAIDLYNGIMGNSIYEDEDVYNILTDVQNAVYNMDVSAAKYQQMYIDNADLLAEITEANANDVLASVVASAQQLATRTQSDYEHEALTDAEVDQRIKDISAAIYSLTAKTDVELNITSAQYATFIAPFSVTVPTGLTAYVVTGYGETDEAGERTELTLSRINTIPKNTPVIFYGETPQTYIFSGVIRNHENSHERGLLTGTYVPQTITSGYVLQNGIHGTAFYMASEEDPITVPSGRAYIAASANAKVLTFGNDDATAIDALNGLTSGNAEIYDLNGRKQDKLQRGVNIVNGVKVIVK